MKISPESCNLTLFVFVHLHNHMPAACRLLQPDPEELCDCASPNVPVCETHQLVFSGPLKSVKASTH